MMIKVIILSLIVMMGLGGYLWYINIQMPILNPVEQSINNIELINKRFESLSLKIIRVRNVEIQGIEYELNNNQKIIFSLKKEIKTQLDSLQLILQRAKIEGRNIKSIDFRFDKTIIKNE